MTVAIASDRKHSFAMSGRPDRNAADANVGCSMQGKANGRRLLMELAIDGLMFSLFSSLLSPSSLGSFFPFNRPWCIGSGSLGAIMVMALMSRGFRGWLRGGREGGELFSKTSVIGKQRHIAYWYL